MKLIVQAQQVQLNEAVSIKLPADVQNTNANYKSGALGTKC